LTGATLLFTKTISGRTCVRACSRAIDFTQTTPQTPRPAESQVVAVGGVSFLEGLIAAPPPAPLRCAATSQHIEEFGVCKCNTRAIPELSCPRRPSLARLRQRPRQGTPGPCRTAPAAEHMTTASATSSARNGIPLSSPSWASKHRRGFGPPSACLLRHSARDEVRRRRRAPRATHRKVVHDCPAGAGKQLGGSRDVSGQESFDPGTFDPPLRLRPGSSRRRPRSRHSLRGSAIEPAQRPRARAPGPGSPFLPVSQAAGTEPQGPPDSGASHRFVAGGRRPA
jgi:hypothetical protein